MVKPIGGNNGNNDDNDDRDNGNNNGSHGNNGGDDGNDRDDNDDNGNDYDNYGDEYLLKLDRLLKNLKDGEEFLKTFKENINNEIENELEAVELERKFENLKNRRLVKERKDAFRKKLNDLNKARRTKDMLEITLKSLKMT